MTSPRFALFVLEALPNARAARRFVEDHAGEIAFVGLSNAERPGTGGVVGQTWRHLVRSSPLILPWLAVNFGLPDVTRWLHPLFAALASRPLPAEAIPLARLCARHAIPTLRIDGLESPQVEAAFRTHAPDLIVVFHFDQIFSMRTLALAPLGGINVHPGLLPRHRGPVPTIHALAEETPAFGVSVHRIVAKIDAGGLLAQSEVALPAGTSATGASIILHEHGRVLLEGVIADIARDGMPGGEAPASLPYCPFPNARLLWSLLRRGRRLVVWRDIVAALSLGLR